MSDLDRLFYWRGIAPDFYNFQGDLTPVSIERRIQILNAMGVDTSTDGSISKEAFELDIKPWLQWLPALEVIKTSHPYVEINFRPEELDQSFTWSLELNGQCLETGEFVPNTLQETGNYVHDDMRFSRRKLLVQAQSVGYYILSLKLADKTQSSTLAICPETAYQPDWMRDPSTNLWGFVLQLYTLRSANNWGIGDFTDLKVLLNESAKYGADLIGLNPFHALQADLQHNYSPYAPSDRRFLNPLYVDVELAPGYDPEFKPSVEVDKARSRAHVDYEEMREIKYPALFACFERCLLTTPELFRAYLESTSKELIEFANFEAMVSWQPEELAVEPVKLQDLLASLEANNTIPATQQLVAFYCYLQWVAESQLEDCQALADSLDMKIGLLRDLAVGASGSGAESETNSQLFCRQAAIGAPPDPFSHTGQNWGIPPMDPAELRRTGFKHFISLLRSNMAHCGALRIDHAMSLYRLWWCASGARGDQGAYIYYPFREMLALLCLESHLNKCLVVAEDLGVVPDEFRAAMTETSLFANRIFYFEKWHDTEFKHPGDYDRYALAMLDNHDVPTLASWWNASDLELRKSLDLFENDSDYHEQKRVRKLEKQNLIAKIKENASLPESWEQRDLEACIDLSLARAIVEFIAGTNSQLFILQLEDLLLMNDPVNIPGTFLEHKNWSRKLEANIEDIFSDTEISAFLSGVQAVRASTRGK